MLDFNITPKYKAVEFYNTVKPEVICAMQALTQQLGTSGVMQQVNTQPQAESSVSPNDDVGDM